MRNMTRTFAVILAAISLEVLLPANLAWGQGCIVARSSEPEMGPESQGGYLQPGDFEATIGYRHQFSFIHFVGPVKQSYRQQLGTQVENKINLENINLTYQVTSRFSVTASVPVLFASRRSNSSYSTQTSSGIGDSSIVAQSWLWNPRRARRGNLAIGLGLSIPTGPDDVTNNLISSPGKSPVNTPVDYSIQPGQGSWGMVFEAQAFRAVGQSVFYADANYLATQGGYNNVLRSATALSQPLTAYNAIQDQYLFEAGVSHPVSRIKGLTLTFGPRDEGVPAKDIIGNNLGFRRPGFAISLMPGLIYARGTKHGAGRNRKSSVPRPYTQRSGRHLRHSWRCSFCELGVAGELYL